MLTTRRSVLANTGRRDEQAADVAALELLAEQMNDDAKRARSASLRASHALAIGDYAAAVAAAERAVAWAASAGEHEAALDARINWARALQFQGDYASAQTHAEASLELARRAGERRVESTTLGQLGILAFQLGRYGAARDYYRQALELARSIGDRSVESGMINNLGDTERLLGNYDAAFELLQQGRQLAREIGQRMGEAYLLCNLAHIAFLRDDAVAAIELSAEAHEMALALKDRDLEAAVLCTRGHALAALGRDGEAATCYGEAVAIYRDLGRPTMPPEPMAGLARLALQRNDVVAAARTVEAIVAHLDGGGTVDGTEDPLWIHLTCHLALVAASHPRGDEFLDRSHGLLMQRAATLDEHERATFLGNVPSHRAVLAAWAARGSAAQAAVSGSAATGA